jgi:hypothetical protein
VNQLATPGLGSLLAGRRWVGVGQLLLFLAGFVIFMFWFGALMKQMYAEMVNYAPHHSVAWVGEVSVLLCGVSWVWSLFTSLSILHEGRQTGDTQPPPLPPEVQKPGL